MIYIKYSELTKDFYIDEDSKLNNPQEYIIAYAKRANNGHDLASQFVEKVRDETLGVDIKEVAACCSELFRNPDFLGRIYKDIEQYIPGMKVHIGTDYEIGKHYIHHSCIDFIGDIPCFSFRSKKRLLQYFWEISISHNPVFLLSMGGSFHSLASINRGDLVKFCDHFYHYANSNKRAGIHVFLFEFSTFEEAYDFQKDLIEGTEYSQIGLPLSVNEKGELEN